jgi:hypothetical protein
MREQELSFKHVLVPRTYLLALKPKVQKIKRLPTAADATMLPHKVYTIQYTYSVVWETGAREKLFRCSSAENSVANLIVYFMYRRPILCTFHVSLVIS